MSKIADGLILGEDSKVRCYWPGSDPLYCNYHDNEWGKPIYDDNKLFEKICLEGFQSGLSWITILRKRENFRAAFDNFDYKKIARYDDAKIADLVADAGIVRHKGKICSVVNNALRAIELVNSEGSLSDYFWSFKPPVSELFQCYDYATLKANPISAASTRLSKDLKKRGWSFVGPTTCHAFMQSVGIVNEHIEGCFCR